MKRLTEMNESGTAHFYPQCFEKCGGVGYSHKCDSCDLQDRACDKLGEYEDLEEQGRLLKLPCAVGNTVYKTDKYYGEIISTVVKGIEIYNGEINVVTDLCRFRTYSFGKSVFLTREEAKAALKELRE